MKILVTICARGGSKGIPNKNIKPINNKPLIAYTIEIAKKIVVDGLVDIGLSTDSDPILQSSKEYGLTTEYRRPDHLANDEAGKLDVIKALLKYEEEKNNVTYDFVIDLDVTSPLRTVEDILTALNQLINSEGVNLFSVNKASRNPYFNMVEKQDNGFYNLVKQGSFLTRQSAPQVFELNASFYIFKRAFFENYTRAITPYSLIYVMPHICFDLDEVIDFEFMDYLISNNKLNFLM